MMAEVVRKEPVLIENVNLIINVYNIGHDEFGQLSLHSQGHSQPGGFLQGELREVSNVRSNCASTEASYCRQGPASDGCETAGEQQLPLGWIANLSGDVIPFGVQSTTTEMANFGDPMSWKEIRVCLPPCLLADNETDLHCPVTSCREKLPKNKSMDSHIKKHLGLVTIVSSKTGGQFNSSNDGVLPCPLVYYCQEKSCQYYVETAEKSFKAYKNVKQHYQKVHAPKLFECDLCQKTFSTFKVAETHKLMCGEKYSCCTCDALYNSLEALQTHCRRKIHVYDSIKYKDRRNSVKQEIQSLKSTHSSPSAALPSNSSVRKAKGARKFPILLPKVATSSNDGVFSSIQALCQQAGVKVDYGCQTVCTAVLQKSDPVKAVITSPSSSITHKKRKSTDTQTNIVKFRATCLDQKHNATNTNLDWKKVITSDSQTQTADSCDNEELSKLKVHDIGADTSKHFNDEFATIRITDPNFEHQGEDQDVKCSSTEAETKEEMNKDDASGLQVVTIKSEVTTANNNTDDAMTAEVKVAEPENGPNLFEEFISFLEGIDSSTQTDPDMFEKLGGDLIGINVNLEDFCGPEKTDYVSVSSTASQTAVENIPTMSLSAEDYEALLNTADDKVLADLPVFSDYMKNVAGTAINRELQGDNDLDFDWEDIVEEVYRDADSQTKNSQL